MAPLSSYLPEGAPYAVPTQAAKDAAFDALCAATDEYFELDLRRAFQDLYQSILGPPVRRQPGSAAPTLSGRREIDLSARGGPGVAWDRAEVHTDLVQWANRTLPGEQVVGPTWGLSRPDLGFLATSADLQRRLVAATGEVKVSRPSSGLGPGRTASSEQSARHRESWRTAVAQECVYALAAAEQYGSVHGLVAVDTVVNRLVVLDYRREHRELLLEVSDDLLGQSGEEITLEELLRLAGRTSGPLGALDLRSDAGVVDADSLARLCAFLHASADCLGRADEAMDQRLTGESSPAISPRLALAVLAQGEAPAASQPEPSRRRSPASSPSSPPSKRTCTRTRRPTPDSAPAAPHRRSRSSSRSPPPPAQGHPAQPAAPAAPAPTGISADWRSSPEDSPDAQAAGATTTAQRFHDWLASQGALVAAVAPARALFPGRPDPDGSLVDVDGLVDAARALRVSVWPVSRERFDRLLGIGAGPGAGPAIPADTAAGPASRCPPRALELGLPSAT